jgi:hypothetical protein
MTGKFWAAWAGYVLATFVGGAVWHLVLFQDVYVELGIFSRIEDPVIPLGVSAMLIQGGFLAYLYPLVSDRQRPVFDGGRFGVLVGVFLATSAVLAEAGKNYVASLGTWLALEGSYYVLQFALSGMVIGVIYGRRAIGAGASAAPPAV